MWTVKDVADYLQISKSWVYKRSADGTLPCIRIGSSLRFVPDVIIAMARGERPEGGQVIAFRPS